MILLLVFTLTHTPALFVVLKLLLPLLIYTAKGICLLEWAEVCHILQYFVILKNG